jgi:hypothetical protein
MSLQTWQETLIAASTDGPSRSTFTTAVSMLPPESRYTIPANFFVPGKSLRIRATGRVSNVVTAQPTFTVDFRLGPTSNIVVWNGGAMLTSTTVHTTVPWMLEVMLTCRAIGAGTSATLFGVGTLESRAFVDSGATADAASGHSTLVLPETTPAVGTGFDSTVANVADMFVACSVSNAANLWQCHQYVLESLN